MMAKNDLSTLIGRISGPTSEAWEVGDVAAQRILSGADIIHLGVGDPDLDTPSEIQEAAFKAIKLGKTHYAPISGELDLREAIAQHATGLYGSSVAKENVVVCNGAQAALFSTFQCICETGDEVIVLEPFYATYPAVITSGGATMVSVHLSREEGYKLDTSKIKMAVTDKTKAILINSPGNPTGSVFDRDEVMKLAHFCSDQSIWLVTDEVYWSLCFEGEHVSAYSNKGCRDKIIVVNSLSKSHAMTGWRLGWAIGPSHFIKSMSNYLQAAQFGINQFVQSAAIVALKDTDTTAKFNSFFKSRRDALCNGLRKSNHLTFSIPQGGMFVLLDISMTELSGKQFAERLLDEENVAVVPGFGFGSSVSNTVRIGFLCDEKQLTIAAERIVRFADRLCENT